MIQLSNQYKKFGYTFSQVSRVGDVAIYAQESDGKVFGYEVFIIQKNEENTRFGKTFPASESVPPTSAWGKEAFTCRSMDEAKNRAGELAVRQNERLVRKTA